MYYIIVYSIQYVIHIYNHKTTEAVVLDAVNRPQEYLQLFLFFSHSFLSSTFLYRHRPVNDTLFENGYIVVTTPLPSGKRIRVTITHLSPANDYYSEVNMCSN